MSTANSENVRVFKEQYEKLAGKVYLAKTSKQEIQFVEQILSTTNVTQAVTAPLPKDISKRLQSFFKKAKFPTVELNLEDPQIQNQINGADLGLSAAEFGIAAMGAIVEVTTEDSHRLVSSLPRVHIAFIPGSQIIETLDEAAPKLRAIYKRHKNNCNITFISGPSRTADIEMKLFLGVHGPQESHVIVCEWD